MGFEGYYIRREGFGVSAVYKGRNDLTFGFLGRSPELPLLLCATAKKARPAGHDQLAACAKMSSAERRQEKVRGWTIDNRPYKDQE